jgi:hypothetical protein
MGMKAEMFDWIFFAIVLIPSALLVWDWRRDRTSKSAMGDGAGIYQQPLDGKKVGDPR